MKALECVNCGAALPGDPSQGPVRCAYCQTLNERTMAGNLPSPAKPGGGSRNLSLVAIGCSVALVAVVAIIAGGFSFLVGGRSKPGPQATGRSAPPLFQSLPPFQPKTHTPADLSRTTQRGWLELRLSPPPTPYGAFEPVSCLPWALSVAQGWAPDASLERLDVKRLRPDGLVNVQDDQKAEVMFRFLSAAQIKEYERLADLSSQTSVPYGFFLRLQNGHATALIIDGKPRRDELPPAYPRALPLPRLLENARSTGRFPEKPFYQGYMINFGKGGWVWYLNSLSGRESLPRLVAETGLPVR